MRREELEELHYITHVANVPSIRKFGLLSHRRAHAVAHRSVADPEVQDRRKGKRVPGGLLLHDYVNVYMTARNPMLYLLARARDMASELCVVGVSTDVLDLPRVVVTDMNAASPYCSFYEAGEGLDHIDESRVFRHYWTDGDAVEQELCKKAKCAEVLVPNEVDRAHLTSIYVGTEQARAALGERGGLPVTTNAELFFDP